MSWILKQAEDMLNRVDQQANAAINQNLNQTASKSSTDRSTRDSPTFIASNVPTVDHNRLTSMKTRRGKKNEDSDLIDYLNSSTPVNNRLSQSILSNSHRSDTARTASSPNMIIDDDLSATSEQFSSKSASNTPRSITPAAQSHDDDEGLVLVR
jgi:hypothetical protein